MKRVAYHGKHTTDLTEAYTSVYTTMKGLDFSYSLYRDQALAVSAGTESTCNEDMAMLIQSISDRQPWAMKCKQHNTLQLFV